MSIHTTSQMATLKINTGTWPALLLNLVPYGSEVSSTRWRATKLTTRIVWDGWSTRSARQQHRLAYPHDVVQERQPDPCCWRAARDFRGNSAVSRQPWFSISCCAGLHAVCVCAGQAKPSCGCPCHTTPGSLPPVRPSDTEWDRVVAWLRSVPDLAIFGWGKSSAKPCHWRTSFAHSPFCDTLNTCYTNQTAIQYLGQNNLSATNNRSRSL